MTKLIIKYKKQKTNIFKLNKVQINMVHLNLNCDSEM